MLSFNEIYIYELRTQYKKMGKQKIKNFYGPNED